MAETPQFPPTQPSTADTAKDEAAHLKQKAADAGGHVLDEARSETAAVTQEARQQLADLWSQTRSELADQAGTQQTRLASGLGTAGDQLTQMASSADPGLAADVVRDVGDRLGQVGRWLDQHGPDEVLDEVRAFARRRPGTFLLVAAGAGVVLGRLTRGLKDSSGPSTATPSRPAHAVTTPPEATPVATAPYATDPGLAGPGGVAGGPVPVRTTAFGDPT